MTFEERVRGLGYQVAEDERGYVNRDAMLELAHDADAEITRLKDENERVNSVNIWLYDMLEKVKNWFYVTKDGQVTLDQKDDNFFNDLFRMDERDTIRVYCPFCGYNWRYGLSADDLWNMGNGDYVHITCHECEHEFWIDEAAYHEEKDAR